MDFTSFKSFSKEKVCMTRENAKASVYMDKILAIAECR